MIRKFSGILVVSYFLFSSAAHAIIFGLAHEHVETPIKIESFANTEAGERWMNIQFYGKSTCRPFLSERLGRIYRLHADGTSSPALIGELSEKVISFGIYQDRDCIFAEDPVARYEPISLKFPLDSFIQEISEVYFGGKDMREAFKKGDFKFQLGFAYRKPNAHDSSIKLIDVQFKDVEKNKVIYETLSPTATKVAPDSPDVPAPDSTPK